jgi:hypothetical protein
MATKAVLLVGALAAVALAGKPLQHCRTIPRPGGQPVVSCETVVADPSTVKGALIVEGSISSSNEIRVAYDEAGGGNCSVGSLGVKNINALNVYTGNIRYEAVDQTERCCCRSSGRGNACAANESAHP